MLGLPREVSQLFQDWLTANVPNRQNRILGHIKTMHNGPLYSADWSRRMRGEGPYAELIEKCFQFCITWLDLLERVPKLRTDIFSQPQLVGKQLSFFNLPNYNLSREIC